VRSAVQIRPPRQNATAARTVTEISHPCEQRQQNRQTHFHRNAHGFSCGSISADRNKKTVPENIIGSGINIISTDPKEPESARI